MPWGTVFSIFKQAILMTLYFVGTALTTVRPVSPWTRRINVAGLAVAVGLALLDIVGGVKAFNSPRGFLNGVPFQMLFFIATVMILAAMGDVRIMRFGMPRGRPRLARWEKVPAVDPAAPCVGSPGCSSAAPRFSKSDLYQENLIPNCMERGSVWTFEILQKL
jgi:hypothetical protein